MYTVRLLMIWSDPLKRFDSIERFVDESDIATPSHQPQPRSASILHEENKGNV